MKDDVKFYGDRPISSANDDDLGYREMAGAIVKSICEKSPAHGLVLGIEGDWGSGKSSLVKLVSDQLPDDDKIFQYDFNPWLVGNRNGLLHAFFDLLQSAIIDIEGKLTPEKNILTPEARQALLDLSENIRKYETSITTVSSALKSSLSVKARVAGWALVAIQKMGQRKPLVDRKKKVSELLEQLPVRIIIFMDDIDRLIPSEAAEIVRLVKAVANFPNVIYVFSYAQNELAASLKYSLGIRDGHAYLEKIIQVSFKVPVQEAFALRYWFKEKLLSSLQPQTEDGLSTSDDVASRLSAVIDKTGGRCLKTPRAVIRTLDAIALYYPAVKEHVDLGDLVWLQLIRLHSPELYSWIERYIHEAASAIGNSQVSFYSTEKELLDLKQICNSHKLDMDAIAMELSDYLPGIISRVDNISHERKWFGWQDLGSFNLGRANHNKRLSSSTHYRYYFSLSPTKESLDGDTFNRIILSLAETDDVDVNSIIQGERGPARAEQFLALLGDWATKMTDKKQIIAAIKFLTSKMDVIGNVIGKQNWGKIWPWVSAQKILHTLFIHPTLNKMDDLFVNFFESGKAIGWLSDVMRQELFAHGRVGDQSKIETEWLLSDKVLDKVIEVMHQRYKDMDLKTLTESPDPLEMLYAWLQSNGEADLRDWVKPNIKSDTDLIEFLWACRSCMVSDRFYYPIKKSSVSLFCDYDEAVARIDKIDPKTLPDASIVRRLSDVKSSLKIGVRDD